MNSVLKKTNLLMALLAMSGGLLVGFQNLKAAPQMGMGRMGMGQMGMGRRVFKNETNTTIKIKVKSQRADEVLTREMAINSGEEKSFQRGGEGLMLGGPRHGMGLGRSGRGHGRGPGFGPKPEDGRGSGFRPGRGIRGPEGGRGRGMGPRPEPGRGPKPGMELPKLLTMKVYNERGQRLGTYDFEQKKVIEGSDSIKVLIADGDRVITIIGKGSLDRD